jgi:hypothetical protein
VQWLNFQENGFNGQGVQQNVAVWLFFKKKSLNMNAFNSRLLVNIYSRQKSNYSHYCASIKGFILLYSKIMMCVNQNPLDNVYFLFLNTNMFVYKGSVSRSTQDKVFESFFNKGSKTALHS